jgi:hypothetical protein
MIKKMFKDLATFLVILLLVIMGFAEAFYHLFAATDILAYRDFSTTWLTLISNLLGEDLTYDAFDSQDNRSLAAIGKSLLTVYLMLASILLLTLMIAMLSDNFRRMADKMNEEYQFGKSQLTQRVIGRLSITHPPLNLLQPFFVVCGKQMGSLPVDYEVEALLTGGAGGGVPDPSVNPATAGSCLFGGFPGADTDAKLDGNAEKQSTSWEYAKVIGPAPDAKLSSMQGLAMSSWHYLMYTVRFESDQCERAYARMGRPAVPVRGRRRVAFPLLVVYGRNEARYLLDLVGSWPIIFVFSYYIWTMASPFVGLVLTMVCTNMLTMEVNSVFAVCIIPFTIVGVVAFMYISTTLLVVVLWLLWILQLGVCMVNVCRGGIRISNICKKETATQKRSRKEAEHEAMTAKVYGLSFTRNRKEAEAVQSRMEQIDLERQKLFIMSSRENSRATTPKSKLVDGVSAKAMARSAPIAMMNLAAAVSKMDQVNGVAAAGLKAGVSGPGIDMAVKEVTNAKAKAQLQAQAEVQKPTSPTSPTSSSANSPRSRPRRRDMGEDDSAAQKRRRRGKHGVSKAMSDDSLFPRWKQKNRPRCAYLTKDTLREILGTTTMAHSTEQVRQYIQYVFLIPFCIVCIEQ